MVLLDKARVAKLTLSDLGALPSPAVLVVAHPDDETLFASSVLLRVAEISLVHVFDGPENEMAEARRVELAEALATLEVVPSESVSLGYPDERSNLPGTDELSQCLAPFLSNFRTVFSHAEEAGHPAHDCVARAVWQSLRSSHRERAIHIEFAAYAGPGAPWPPKGFDRIPLSAAEFTLKKTALECFRSQTDVIAQFHPAFEWLRYAKES